MRCLNTKTLQLEEISSSDFAILSHVWEKDGELLYNHVRDLRKAQERKGFEKIKDACAKALESGWNHLWADTCCINKGNSAELSESINSMYRW